MNELLKMLVLVIAGGCLGAVVYRWYSKTSEPVDTRPVKHVAILTKNLEVHREVLVGVLAVLENEKRVRVIPRIYCSDVKNKITETSITEQAIDDKPDLILAIGDGLSQLAKGIISKRRPALPLVFCAVTDPLVSGLIEALEKPGCNVTGVACFATDKTLCLRLLIKAFPLVKRVLLPYYVESNSAVEEAAHEIAACGKKCGIEVALLPIDGRQHAIILIQEWLRACDAVMILQNCKIQDIAENIAKLARQYGVLFYSPSRALVLKGDAPIGFGVRMDKIGLDAAKIACKILVEGVSPHEVPVEFEQYNQSFFINREALLSQGVPIDQDLLLLLSQAEFVSPNEGVEDASKNSI